MNENSGFAQRLAERAMDRATYGLPDHQRQRYREEVAAEMFGLGTFARLRYALGVRSTVTAMRAALTDGLPVTEAPPDPPPLRCRLNLSHAWVWFSAEDGTRYRACRRCGKDDPHLGSGAGDWNHMFAAG